MTVLTSPSADSHSSTSAAPPNQTPHPPPWQVRWKRPRLDRVVSGIDASGEDSEKNVYEEIENSIRDDWVPISCASVVLTRDEARRAILELQKRDRLLVKKKVSSFDHIWWNEWSVL